MVGEGGGTVVVFSGPCQCSNRQESCTGCATPARLTRVHTQPRNALPG